MQLFDGMSSQWLVGMSGPTGLNYCAIPVVARALRIRVTPTRFADLRVMESVALSALNARVENAKRATPRTAGRAKG